MARTMPKNVTSLVLVGMIVAGGFTPPKVNAQTIRVGNYNVSQSAVTSTVGGSTATYEWNRRHVGKTDQLLSYFKSYQQASSIDTTVKQSFVVVSKETFTPIGSTISATHDVVISIVPVTTTGAKKNASHSAALLLVRYKAADGLGYSRLLIRKGTGTLEEYAQRKDGRITYMTPKFGDSLVNSAVSILAQQNPPAGKAISAVYYGGANNADNAYALLCKIYDVKSQSGQRELKQISDLLISSNNEEEFTSGYISGTLDSNFKPIATDSDLHKLLKNLLKKVIEEAQKEAAKLIWNSLAKWLGL